MRMYACMSAGVRRTRELPDDLLVVLTGDLITEEVRNVYTCTTHVFFFAQKAWVEMHSSS